MHSKKLIFLLLVTISLFQNACFAEKPISQYFKNPPKNVLVGTDVQLLDSFKLAGEIVDGYYIAEMGGANLSVNIEGKDKELKISRSFQEAGLQKEEKIYTVNKINKKIIDTLGISLVKIKSGILLHEKAPKSFGIPTDMWILYIKK